MTVDEAYASANELSDEEEKGEADIYLLPEAKTEMKK